MTVLCAVTGVATVTAAGAIPAKWIAVLITAGAGLVGIVIAAFVGARAGRHGLSQRLESLAARMGDDFPNERGGLEPALAHLERATEMAAEAIAESSADAIRLRRAVDTLPQGMIICDEKGDVAFRNAPADALMGSRHGDALAAQAVDELLAEALNHVESERTIELYGPPRRTLVVRTKLIDDGRRTLGVLAVIDDVSERRRLEEVRRDFVANVSHELKTPMGAVGLLAETLVSETDTAVGQRLASRIHSEAFRISRIIDDLLDLTRIESDEITGREPVPVGQLMAEAVDRVRAMADQRSIAVVVNDPDLPATILGDRRQLVSALYNLLENAVKFSYDGSSVDMLATVADSSVEISVRDRGAGIPARDLERIFERFYRVDPGRSRQSGGTGLGLSIVRHVASNHQGSVEVESREGEGSMFTLRFPARSSGHGAPPPAGPPLREEPSATAAAPDAATAAEATTPPTAGAETPPVAGPRQPNAADQLPLDDPGEPTPRNGMVLPLGNEPASRPADHGGRDDTGA
ncbi:MAG: ATP-binding protein [Actinomycetota bacterium]|nr:ATP-binding protein [Actinomycetota bacterium]